jgi:DNA-directed RNA polymerase III subunit RPC4
MSDRKVSSEGRLPSLRGKRDLTLGGVPKKQYKPIIPPRRPKREEHEIPSSSLQAPPISGNESKEKSKKREDKVTDKRKRDKQVITSSSIFSLGPANKPTSDNSGGRETLNIRPLGGSISTGGDVKTSKIKTDNRSWNTSFFLSSDDEQMSDDDQRVKLFSHSLLPPIQLQPSSYSSTLDTSAAVKIKREQASSDEDEPEKPVRQVKPVVNPTKRPHQLTASQLFTSSHASSSSSNGQLLYIQLPDTLPITPDEPMETDDVDDDGGHLPLPSLRDVPQGHIGELLVHQSGRVTLSLGEVKLSVAMGTKGGFHQEVVSIRPSDPSPSLSVLGPLSHRLICTPDVDSLLSSND